MQTLDELALFLACRVGDPLAEVVGEEVKVKFVDEGLDAVGTYSGLKLAVILPAQFLLVLKDNIAL